MAPVFALMSSGVSPLESASIDGHTWISICGLLMKPCSINCMSAVWAALSAVVSVQPMFLTTSGIRISLTTL